MKIPSDWSDRLEIENGQIYRILTAEYCGRGGYWFTCDVYKENDAGEAWEQNLYRSMWGSCAVAFPGLPRCDNKNSWYYDMTIAQEEGWSVRRNKSSIGWSESVTDRDKDLVCELYPDFRYVLNKWKMESRAELLHKLQMWLEHNEVELVLAAGFEKVAMNKSFWRLTEKNRKAVCLFMRKNPQFKKLSLREIREAMKADSPKDYAEYLSLVPSYHRSSNNRAYYPCISYKDYKYLQKALQTFNSSFSDLEHSFNQISNLYIDYLRMLYASNHDSKDAYWLYPSNLEAMHDRLLEEKRLEEEARELAAQKAADERLKKLSKEIKQVEKKFRELNGNIDGYSIFVTSDYDEWKKQAKALNQCIVASGYYQKMADGKSTIVFIQKDGAPVATAEISTEGKLGQFYADEHDRNDCLPAPEVRAAFEKWFEKVPKSKFKPRQRKNKREVAA